MKLKNKTVIVTGSSSGIGQATAIKFAQQGANVVINYYSNEEGAKKTAQEAEKSGVKTLIVQGDMSQENEVNNLFDQTIAKFGSVDILVSNAGRTIPTPILESSKEDWQNLFNINLFSTMLCSQRAAKIMMKQGQGKILITTSVRGILHMGQEKLITYSATKAAMSSFTKTLAKELAPKIQVNAIAPGFVYTQNYEPLTDEKRQKIINLTYINRLINTKEIGDGFIFLAQNDAMTGEILVIDGGFSLKEG